jgi:hypothetical protein
MRSKAPNTVAVICIAILLCLTPHSLRGDDSKDLVVMVDISASMDPYFEDLVRYFKDDILKGVVRFGDGFHFLSFSSRSEIEISEDPVEEQSQRRIILKLYGLKPFGLYTDLVAAVRFLTDFATALPSQREKVILLLSDGVHDPPPTSPYYKIDQKAFIEDLRSQARILKQKGWAVHILQMPMREQADRKPGETSQKENALKIIADELETDVADYSEKEQVSKEMQTSVQETAKETAQQEVRTRVPIRDVGKVLYPILIILLLLLVIFILVSVIRANSLKTKLDRYMHPSRAYRKFFGFFRSRKTGRLIEMRVDQQNRHIGFRNINLLTPGQTLSVGGGASRFLIFLVPFPPRIASLSFDGDSYTFKPRRMEFFPDLAGPIDNCLDKSIPARSRKGYSITIRFLRYVSPLEEINRILRIPHDESDA